MKQSLESQLVKGHLDMLILAILHHNGPSHGYFIRQRLGDWSNRTVHPSHGRLYPRLREMEKVGWLKSREETVCRNRVRKVYSLTDAGRSELKNRIEIWKSFSQGINRCLRDIRL